MTDEIKTIEDSANGKTNGYILTCSAIGQRRYYATCVHIVSQVGNSKFEPLYGDCFDAIKKKTCPAASMRKEEIAEGKGIYFAERKMVEMVAPITSESEKELRDSGKIKTKGRMTTILPASAPASKRDNDDFAINGFADAINAAMEKETAKVIETVVKPQKPKPASEVQIKAMPGESLLDIARRKLAERAAMEVSN